MRAASTFKRSVVAGSLAAQAVAVGSSQEQEGFVSCSSTCSRVQTYKVFLVQELCNCSLGSAFEFGAFDNEPKITVMSLLHQVACGLVYLHGLGVIHGDLTPGNVLLKTVGNNNGVVVKLADFGLSSRLDGQATHVSNFGAGTPFYVAPEVVHAKRTSPASDIFSLGVIAWQMFTGQAPFVQGADQSLRRNPLFPRLPPGSELPPRVAALLKRCLSAKPRDRPTATEVMEVLDAHLTNSSAT